MSNKYRIYCNNSSQFEYQWADVPPVKCPIDSNHEINTESIKRVAHLSPLYTFPTGNMDGYKSKYYQRVMSFPYDASKNGDIKCIKFLGSMSSKLTSYSVEVYDHRDGISLAEGTFTNTETVQNTILIPELPRKEMFLDINVKIDGKKDKTYIDTIVIYVEVED